MFNTSNTVRHTVVTFAGAFITAMLFVSAAIGPLPLA